MQPIVLVDGAAPALFQEHLDWAASVGRNVARTLPPSFDPHDLQQIAMIEHWRRVGMYDDSTGVPYRAYAYFAIRGAVLMACRRRSYRDSTHEELNTRSIHLVDPRLRPDQETLAREHQRRNVGSPFYLQRLKVMMAIAHLPAEDADLVRQVLAGASVDDLELSTPGTKKRLSRLVMKLKRKLR